MARLILASASPARLELLKTIELVPDAVIPADIDETPLKREKPADYVLRLAITKAETVHHRNPDGYVVAADTVAAVGTRILGKAENAEEARKIISLLSGRKHKVLTGLCVVAPDGRKKTRTVVTVVGFKHLTEKELEQYLASNAWVGKSGCFGLQGRASEYITRINGSVSNVIGLPLYETRNLLNSLGYVPGA